MEIACACAPARPGTASSAAAKAQGEQAESPELDPVARKSQCNQARPL
jgi:hypothetical protein